MMDDPTLREVAQDARQRLMTDRPELLVDLLAHQADRLRVLQGTTISSDDFTDAVRRQFVEHRSPEAARLANELVLRAQQLLAAGPPDVESDRAP